MPVRGADIDDLRALATRLAQAADRLQHSSRGLSSAIANTPIWRGNDADRFRSEWHGSSILVLNAAVDTLRSAADTLRRNADQQEQASASSGGDTRSSAGTGAGSQGNDFSKAPNATNDLWTNLKSYEHIKDSSGYHVQKIEDNGKVRYIVYITGTEAADGQTLGSNIPAALGLLDQKQIDRLKKLIQPPGSEVMLVGHSQGGMDAQNIAHAHVLNVKQVVTFGSPTRNDLDVPVAHLREQQDMMPFIVDAPADVAVLATKNPRLAGVSPYSHTVQDEFIQSARQTFGLGGDSEYFVHDSTGSHSQTSDPHQDYSGVTEAYDDAVAEGKMSGQNISDFCDGKVADEFDIDTQGHAHQPPYEKVH